MIVIKVKGGLGNQLFQYALGLYIETEFNLRVKYEISFFNIAHKTDTSRNLALNHLIKDFNNKVAGSWNNNKINFPPILNKIAIGEYLDRLNVGLNKRFNPLYYMPLQTEVDVKELLKYKFLDGFWQSKDLVLKITDHLIADFNTDFVDQLNMSYQDNYHIMNSDVCIHIRRGDYVNQLAANSTHGLCSVQYYNEAIQYFKIKIKQPRLFFFSDDVNWANETFGELKQSFFIDLNVPFKDLAEFFMMTKFQHFIIANSTYSWWAAILSKSQSVIAPEKWFVNAGNDLALTSWKLILNV